MLGQLTSKCLTVFRPIFQLLVMHMLCCISSFPVILSENREQSSQQIFQNPYPEYTLYHISIDQLFIITNQSTIDAWSHVSTIFLSNLAAQAASWAAGRHTSVSATNVTDTYSDHVTDTVQTTRTANENPGEMEMSEPPDMADLFIMQSCFASKYLVCCIYYFVQALALL